jgi:HEAT repeat protein
VLAGILLLVLAIGPAPQARQEPPVNRRAEVERVCANWRAGAYATPEKLQAAFEAIGTGAVPELCKMLDAGKLDIPLGPIARSIGSLGSPTGFGALKRFAASPLADNRVSAMDALGRLGLEGAVVTLVGALDDASPEVVEAAESALLTTKAPSARIVETVSDRLPFASDKCRVATLLARLGTDEAHDALLKHIDSLDDGVSLAALQALWIAVRTADGEQVLDALTNSISWDVRKQACLLLGKIKHKPAMRELIVCLRDSDPGLHANAYWALKEITGLPLKDDPELWAEWLRRSGGSQPPQPKRGGK